MSPWSTEESWKDDEEEGRRSLIEEDRVGVSVGYLRHVFQYVFFGDDSQQPPNDTEGEREREKRTKVTEKHITSYHTLFASSWKVKRIDRKQRHTHLVEVWPPVLILWLSSVLLQSRRETCTQREIRVNMKTQSKQSERGKTQRPCSH